MRVALLYPPPWKLPSPGEPRHGEHGPPPGYREGDLDGDFYQLPYGLLTIAAEALRAGHQVKVLNLSAYPWADVERVLELVDADVYGMSCWTANRRGVGYVAEHLRKLRPSAHIVVGGPHASPLPVDMLRHHPAIDTVTVSESEATFLELLERVAAGRDMAGLAGAVYRRRTSSGALAIEEGPTRANLEDIDALEPVQRHFDTHILMTSRGCPWACTFCGAESQWGRGFRGHSTPYVLDAIESVLARLPVKMLLIKDDTFTTNKKRVLELCRGIRERKLSFLWSCDTRVDLLTDELLREMRLAGCQRLSLGVESGSPTIIRNVDKKITVDEILASTALAKKYGIRVRYFMMLGNRGETTETFRETLEFLERARPHEYIFSCLSIYPGTHDFTDAERAGWLDRSVYFSEPFQELKVPYDADEATTRLMNDWFSGHAGLQRMHAPSVAELREVAVRLDGHHASLVDLGGALFHEGELDEAERVLLEAIERGYPTPGLALNYLACIAVERGDYDAMMDRYTEAARRDPQHAVLIRNVESARRWFRERGPERGIPLRLVASHDFQLLERTQQPTLPGPLAANVHEWAPPAAASSPADTSLARVGSTHALLDRRRLKLV
ncbi:MAG: radical SAM protein [Deltaproteobacteria bacterium]|nr:radical SAM protein [Deltaproteobacteria bacterium]